LKLELEWLSDTSTRYLRAEFGFGRLDGTHRIVARASNLSHIPSSTTTAHRPYQIPRTNDVFLAG